MVRVGAIICVSSPEEVTESVAKGTVGLTVEERTDGFMEFSDVIRDGSGEITGRAVLFGCVICLRR